MASSSISERSREIGGGHDDAAGALAIRRAGLIVRGLGGLEIGGMGFDGDRRCRG